MDTRKKIEEILSQYFDVKNADKNLNDSMMNRIMSLIQQQNQEIVERSMLLWGKEKKK